MKHIKQSPGFSLILSLTVMAGIVMLLVTVSAFITIESRAAMNHQLATRARLNAIVSMRLALAHLQQEAGPDRRSTARADITQPEVIFAYKFRNPMWTGVWRSDFPDLPPAWLVSGRGDQLAGTQSVSLFQTEKTADYHAGYWAPWQSLSATAPEDMVNLVSLGSALPATDSRPSGIITLPKVSLPDEMANGRYAYWIGDEGIKARINLADTRSTSPVAAERLAGLRSPVTAGFSMLAGLKSLTRPEQLPGLDTPRQLDLLSGFDSTAVPAPHRSLFHDVSLVSAGVLADSLHGGLKRDLSRAFELSDAAFASTEFGDGLRKDFDTPDGAAGTHTEFGFAGRTRNRNSDDPLMMPIVTGSNGNGVGNAGLNAVAAPVFNRTTLTGGQVRGPAWWALRDYHRLYKQIGWSAAPAGSRATGIPELRARSFWPNIATSRPNGNPDDNGLPNNGWRQRVYGYGDIYNGDLSSDLNPNASDVLNGDRGRLVTRPLHVAATPYIQRVLLGFGFTSASETFRAPKPARGNITYYSIYLNVSPIIVVHNPYNVRMLWQPTSSANGNDVAYAAALSLSSLADWKLRLAQAGLDPIDIPLEKLLKGKNAGHDDEDSLRIYLGANNGAAIAIEPGEYRVFTCPPIAAGNVTEWTPSVAAVNTYNGGQSLELGEIVADFTYGDGDGFNELNDFTAQIIPGPKLSLRHALDCWPGDQLLFSANNRSPKETFFRNSSEQTELVFTDIPLPAASSAQLIHGWDGMVPKYSSGLPTGPGQTQTPSLFSVVDISAKTADVAGAPFPTFTHSNPLAASLRASGSGRLGTGSNQGARGAGPSHQVTIWPASDWNSLIEQPDIQTAFGGHAVTKSKGSERVILTEIPLVQPTSLAQFAHANFGVRDQQPLLSVGNSFASPLVAATQVVQNNGPNWTEFDQNYLLNAALWDGFFLSSLAPWMQTTSTAATLPTRPNYKNGNNERTDTLAGVTTKSLATVIADFVDNRVPLDNPRFSLELGTASPDVARQALDDYRRTASVLLNQGAFNVNSTSVDAWCAFLGSAKNQALQGLAADRPAPEANARFIRALSRLSTPDAVGSSTDDSNWKGFANLSDIQLRLLAQAIVTENKARFGVQVRGERDLRTPPGARRFGGHDRSATPYLGLAEFINRFLCDQTWANRCGALQAAILRADATDRAKINSRLHEGAPELLVNRDSLTKPAAGWFPNPENIEVGAGSGQLHTALAAPGNLIQSDLLQSLGSALTARSDTFTLRCFGEAINPTGETGAVWVEAVVQRVPEFIDPTNPAETGSSAPKPLAAGATANTDATVSPSLTGVNQILGRRFKIVSFRWLKADEI